MMRGALAVVRKDLAGHVRDRRLPAFLVLVALLLAIPLALVRTAIVAPLTVPALDAAVRPVRFAGPIVLLLLAVLASGDALSREREAGTLALLASSPVTDAGLFLGKLATALAAYGVTATVVLLFLLPWTLALGPAFLEVAAWTLALPFLLLYLLLVAVGLLASASLDTAGGSVTTTFAVGLLLLLLQRGEPGLGGVLADVAPGLAPLLRYTPFDAAATAAARIPHGQPLPLGPLAVTLALALALFSTGLAVTMHREVTT